MFARCEGRWRGNRWSLKHFHAGALFWMIPCVCCVLSCLCQVRLYNPMDCSPPGSSLHGILQARILEWVAMPSSRGSSQPRDWNFISWRLLHWQAGSSPLVPPAKPLYDTVDITIIHFSKAIEPTPPRENTNLK